MKKIKRIALSCIAFALMFCLCSCDYLDELRSSQAFWGKDEDNDFINDIIFADQTYKRFETEYEFISKYSNYIHVTNNDVPVLLSKVMGQTGKISDNKEYISMGGAEYVRDDVYEKYLDKINNIKFDSYGIVNYDCIKDINIFQIVPRSVSDSFAKAIAGQKYTSQELDLLPNESLYYLQGDIMVCDSEGLFTNNLYYSIFETSISGRLFLAMDVVSYSENNKYDNDIDNGYLRDYGIGIDGSTENYAVEEEMIEEEIYYETVYYEIPQEDCQTVRSFFKAINSDKYGFEENL